MDRKSHEKVIAPNRTKPTSLPQDRLPGRQAPPTLTGSRLGNLARNQGCRIVALTDSNQSPIIQIAQIAFLISISATSFVDAYAAPITFVNGLITEFAERYPNITQKSMACFETFTEGMNIWHQTKNKTVGK